MTTEKRTQLRLARVRTAAGSKRYHLPIGSVIVYKSGQQHKIPGDRVKPDTRDAQGRRKVQGRVADMIDEGKLRAIIKSPAASAANKRAARDELNLRSKIPGPANNPSKVRPVKRSVTSPPNRLGTAVVARNRPSPVANRPQDVSSNPEIQRRTAAAVAKFDAKLRGSAPPDKLSPRSRKMIRGGESAFRKAHGIDLNDNSAATENRMKKVVAKQAGVPASRLRNIGRFIYQDKETNESWHPASDGTWVKGRTGVYTEHRGARRYNAPRQEKQLKQIIAQKQAANATKSQSTRAEASQIADAAIRDPMLVKELSDQQLRAAEFEMRQRAIKLGKPGKKSAAHNRIIGEINRRKRAK